MKKHFAILFWGLLILTTGVGVYAQNGQIDYSIQDSDFKEFDYTQATNLNPFDWFKGAGLLLASGDKEHHNAMTIGWGALGNVWGYNVNTTAGIHHMYIGKILSARRR